MDDFDKTGCAFLAMWVGIMVFNLVVWGVIIWAIIKVVNYLTGTG